MNEITALAYVNIVEGVLILIAALLFDFIAPNVGMHHAKGVGSFQGIVSLYAILKIIWGICLYKGWR